MFFLWFNDSWKGFYFFRNLFVFISFFQFFFEILILDKKGFKNFIFNDDFSFSSISLVDFSGLGVEFKILGFFQFLVLLLDEIFDDGQFFKYSQCQNWVVQEWSVQQVFYWLMSLNLEQYVFEFSV